MIKYPIYYYTFTANVVYDGYVYFYRGHMENELMMQIIYL
jgi:hypothetical protein